MSITDDLDSDALISRLAGPLSPPARAAFRAAAEDALTRVPCWGEGAIYRAVASLQRAFFDPPTECRAHWDIRFWGEADMPPRTAYPSVVKQPWNCATNRTVVSA